MNYKKHYDLLIEKARSRPILKENKEKHHIIPKCMGGTNDSLNIAVLTYREHYIAHWLLHKTYPKHRGLILALHKMMYGQTGKRLVLSSKDFENIRSLCSDAMKGEGNPMWGKKHSLESRRKNSKSQQKEKHHLWGKKRSKETKNKMSNSHKNKKLAFETIEKIRNNKRCKRVSINGQKFRSIKEASRQLNKTYGFVYGRLKSEKFPTYKYI